jgi:hypothetical protein
MGEPAWSGHKQSSISNLRKRMWIRARQHSGSGAPREFDRRLMRPPFPASIRDAVRRRIVPLPTWGSPPLSFESGSEGLWADVTFPPAWTSVARTSGIPCGASGSGYPVARALRDRVVSQPAGGVPACSFQAHLALDKTSRTTGAASWYAVDAVGTPNRASKREPGESPGLPRSGKQERKPSLSTGIRLGSDGR